VYNNYNGRQQENQYTRIGAEIDDPEGAFKYALLFAKPIYSDISFEWLPNGEISRFSFFLRAENID
jgi:hypothetical protein